MRQNVTTPDQGQPNSFANDGQAMETRLSESIGSDTEKNFIHHQQVMLLKERSATIAALVDKASADDDDWNQVMGDLTAQYGAGLERLDSYSKHVLRASLSLYLCWQYKLTEQRVPIPETLIDEAIDQADPDCWSSDRDIDRHICAIATLHPHDITHLLEVLNQQLSEMSAGQGRGAV
jgi:hypothetical protein